MLKLYTFRKNVLKILKILYKEVEVNRCGRGAQPEENIAALGASVDGWNPKNVYFATFAASQHQKIKSA